MHTSPEAASAAEWAMAAMSLRAVFGSQQAEDPRAVELRISVTANAVPGLAVIEWELIDRDGDATAGGAL